MSLASALPAFKSNLQSTFTNLNQTPTSAGVEIGTHSLSWGIQGIPMTMDNGLEAPGQAVAGAVTVSPGAITANGLGGIDSTSPGSGLAPAKAALSADLVTLFTKIGVPPDSPGNTYQETADGMSKAFNKFFLQSKIMTMVTGIAPPGQATPPPAGPVGTGPWTGTGIGGVDASSRGPSLSAMVSTFQSSLTAVFSNIGNPPNAPCNTVQETADHIANAAEAFFLSALITTVDSGTAGGGAAVVAPPPAPPVGSTVSPSPATGNSTVGVIA